MTLLPKLADKTEIDVVNENRALVSGEFQANSNMDPQLEGHGLVEEETEKNEMEEDDIILGGNQLVKSNVVNLNQSVSNIENDGISNATIRSFNIKQREAFDIAHKWTRVFVKYQSSKVFKKIPPFFILLTGVLVLKSHV